MKFSKSLSSLSFAFFCIIWILLIPYSCKKITALEEKEKPALEDLIQKFFKVPENASDALKTVIAEIKKQNDKHHFVNSVAAKYGLPVWERSVANSKLNNNSNARGLTDSSLQLFLIPFRGADSSVTSYLLCSNNNGDFAYRYYKKDHLSALYAANDSIKKLRSGLLSVFGYFEKTINNKDSTHIGGIYNKNVKEVSINFSNALSGGRVTDGIYWIRICWDGMLAARMNDTYCFDYAVYSWSVNDMGWGSYGGGSGGSGGGVSNFPDGYQCPNGEWWCVQGDNILINGVVCNPTSYPGISSQLPWLWWENGAGAINSFDHLSNVLYSVDNLFLSPTQANWLAFNSYEAQDLYLTVEEFLNLGPISENVFTTLPAEAIRNAAKIAIDASLINYTSGPYNLNHFVNMICQYYPNLLQNASNINPAFWMYFSMECALLKIDHPNWSDFRIYVTAMGNTLLEIVHTGLDIAGMVPAIGEIADLVNGGIYTIQGEGVNAALSFSAAIPIAGWGATIAKYAKKAITALDGTTRTLKWMKRTDGIIEFGDRNLLRRVLGLAKGDARVAHHIIPWEHGTHNLVQKAANGANPFNLNEILNGIPLNSLQHTPPHGVYNSKVLTKLDNLWNQNGGVNMSTQTAETLVRNLANQVRDWLVANPNTPINDIVL